jgi:two-component sensor histidine kinase
MPLGLAPAPDAIPSPRPPDAAAEAHHRIANHLTMIASLARIHGADLAKSGRAMSGNDIKLAFDELGGRIETVARLHRLLTGRAHGAPIDLADYLHDLAEGSIASLSAEGGTELEFVAGPGCFAPAERALPLGFIITELLTNAIKYGHPAGVAGMIRIACERRADGTIAIEISDDGVGLPETMNPATDGSLGFRLVRLQVGQIGARINYRSTSLGLSVLLELPIVSLV